MRWNSPVHGVKKELLQKDYSEGGLKLINLSSFITTLKYTWVIKHFQSDYTPRTPAITINLNRLIDKSLEHNVKESKVWHEFHLNDQGKKRSFVLQFQKGPEFDEFYQKLQNVIITLNACREGKATTNKKYILVGFKQKESKEFIQTVYKEGHCLKEIGSAESRNSAFSSSSSSSKNSPSNFYTSPPFLPKPYTPNSQFTRVTGLEEVLERNKITCSATLDKKTPEEKYYKEIYGSLSEPPSGQSLLKSIDESAWTVVARSDIGGRETIKGHKQTCKDLSDQEENLGFLQSLRITEIDINTKNSKNIDKDNSSRNLGLSEGFNYTAIDFECTAETKSNIFEENNLLCVCAENLRMKSRQEQNQLKQYTQLLQAAINDGDQENARQYADFLAASHIKVSVLLDESSLNEETNDQDIKIKVFVEDKDCSGGSLLLTVKLNDTIGDLKAKMFFKHKFPVEVQKWIVGKRIPKDEETLQRLRVTNGQTVFLYLVSAKSVGLDKKHRMTVSGYVDTVMTEPGLPQNQMKDLTCSNAEMIGKPSTFPTPRECVKAPAKKPQPARGETTASALDKSIGWHCQACTFLNLPTRPGCEMCSQPRPRDYKIPDNYVMSKEELERLQREQEDERKAQQLELNRTRKEEEESQHNFQQLLRTDHQNLVANTDNFECPICFDRITSGGGVILRECLHSFCRECLKGAIIHNEEAYLKCPYHDDSYSCNASLQDREIKALVPVDVYERYLQKSLSTAESQEINSFHCKTPDCRGWCIYEDHVNFFNCPICKKENCMTCKAIHEGVNCKKYQDDLQSPANNNAAAKRTKEMLYDMVNKGDAMHCPQCKVILQKKDGCDWIKCSICKTEICWVTKGPRWGPNGLGDISGGCRCRINAEPCHPDCNNCH
ncbi:ranBP-type and C3HC4-type zinc finger-containing protein 1-like isoform X1 [Mytilus californianus]|uniref:ranBP-type and C3HC4-type zinc finger-containing protein 1-like isoform X1 n=1 Tax=Mytilus californianus TaxID=6549 RepID=UPI002246620B|nr:ranBP-type and C3HC4-type zinc finger-containing protein 1-like isoform X1 [Mytilus californianus]